ncbi:MAG: hypothetical protein PWQ18_1566, partial [Clostridia bacterium]|nr:hypothetical protein [Clostridia bacterium]
YVQKDFNARMFIYFSRLFEKHRLKILPIAVFSYDQPHDEPDSFTVNFSFLDVLQFHFYKLELKKLYWRDYINSDNPVAAALLSKMGFNAQERVRVKVEFMRMLTRLRLDPARMELLGGFFESYLKLNQQEEEDFYKELGKMDRKEADVIMQITTSWHEKGRMEGKMEGRIEGKVEAKQDAICKYLARRFGERTGDLQQAVQEVHSLELLDRILEELFAADNFETARKIVQAHLVGLLQ